MRLRELLGYDDIVVQCHDNPDADAIASGYAVYRYFAEQGKRCVSCTVADMSSERAIWYC